jgi:glutaconate CoA-transferase, subunit A
MPALRLDVAVVHANRADQAGNAQFLGPDPYFYDLFLGAAARRFVTAESVVAPGTLTDHGPLSSVTVHRLLTDGVAEAPRGAHFTACPPDYGRDEPFQQAYTAAAADADAFAAFRQRYLDVGEADYQRAVAEREGAAP